MRKGPEICIEIHLRLQPKLSFTCAGKDPMRWDKEHLLGKKQLLGNKTSTKQLHATAHTGLRCLSSDHAEYRDLVNIQAFSRVPEKATL